MANDYSQINPDLRPTVNLNKFRFWCQKVLPLVYDDSISYYEVLGKMVVYLNQVIDNVNADTENVLTLKDAFIELQEYVAEVIHYDIHDLEEAVARAVESAQIAETSAEQAHNSAVNASDSATNAADAAIIASNMAGNASTSATNAATSSQSAATSSQNAAESAMTAISYGQQAQRYATSAGQSSSNANQAQLSAQEDALKAEGLAVGQQNGVDVEDGSPYYHKNAKYYAEQAGQGAGALPLSELPDTYIVDPTNGQILAYDATNEKWINSDDVQGVTSLAALTDTDIVAPASGEVLMYDAVNQLWLNSPEKEVAISPSAPSDPATKIWINETPQTPISLATAEELAAMGSRVSELEVSVTAKANVVDVDNALASKENKPTIVSQSAPTSLALADNYEYYLTNVRNLIITFPANNFECWLYVETANNYSSLVLPSSASFIGNEPTFASSEKWEISIKNGIVIAGKVE